MARILIVEDEPIAAWSVREALEAAGHTIVNEVVSGSQAIQIATANLPDVVLMDIRLADDTDGLEAAKAISSTLNIPVIFLTAYADDTTIQQALATSPFGYVVKPFRRRELQTSIDIAIQRHQRERGLMASKEQLTTTLASLGDAVITVDLEGRVTFLNPVAERLTQWEQSEALGQPIETVLPLFDQNFQPITNPLLLALQSEQTQHLPDECLLRTRQGQYRYVGDSATVMRNEAGQVLGGVLIFQDITENKRVEHQLRQQANQERVLNTVALTIRRSLDLQEILDTTTGEIRQLLETDRVLIGYFGPPLQTIMAASVNPAADMAQASNRCLSSLMTSFKEQADQAQVQVIEDIELAEIAPDHRQRLQDAQVRAQLVVPIICHDNELWGLLMVQSCRTPRHWHPWEVTLIQQLTLQLVLAIQHSQLYEKSQRQARQAKLLNQIVHAIRTSLQLSAILQQTVTSVLEAFQASRCVIRLGSPLLGYFTHSVHVVSSGVERLQDSTMPICDNPLMAMLFASDSALAISDVMARPELEMLQPYFVRSHIQAVLTVAIRFQHHIKGVICLHQCDQTRDWLSDEIQLLEQVADQIAVAIDQAELYQNLKQANQELRRMAHLDGLTQVANRTAFDQYFDNEFRRHQREDISLSLIMCDVDHFKHYNDTYGHIRGDDCLRTVALALATVLKRPGDMVARYGGEEFALILPNTDAEGMQVIAEAIQAKLKQLAIPHRGLQPSFLVTVSMGLANQTQVGASTPTELIAAADWALYRAKALGRNRYAVANHPIGSASRSYG